MAKSEQVRVVFIRSGRTEWDAAGRIAGSTDLPVAAACRAEIAEVVRAIGPAKLSAVVSAPDEASLTTAHAVAGNAIGSPKVKAIPELAEICLGLWEGQLKEDLARKFPSVCRQWQEDPAGVMVPEGETFAEAQDRVVAALKRVLVRASGDEAVAVVLRPIALGLGLCWVDGAELRNVWPMVEGVHGPVWRTLRRELLRATRRTRAEV